MNKKLVKVFSVLLMVIMICSISLNVLALTPSQITADTTVGTENIQSIGQKVVGILQAVGIVLSVIILIILGIKYMMGSAEEKAEYKKTLLPYIIGAALVFAAATIASVVFNFASSI